MKGGPASYNKNGLCGHLIQILRVGEMLMYLYVHCAFSPLKSYYMAHISHFYKSVFCGRLVRCLRDESVLIYYFVNSGTFALDAYYSSHISHFYKSVLYGRLVRCVLGGETIDNFNIAGQRQANCSLGMPWFAR